MSCEEMSKRISDRLKGLLDGNSERELREHLKACATCREEAAATERIWDRLGEFDEDVPSERMRSRFYTALHAYQQAPQEGPLTRLVRGLEGLWPRRAAFQFGLAVGVLVIGLLLGRQFAPAPSGEIESLRAEVESLGWAVSLSLLQHESASQRLRGVGWTQRSQPDDRVVEALLDAVERDPSVNVRLAAVEALSPLLDRPRIGRSLLETLPRQTTPMLQVTLAVLLLDAGVDGSRPAVERMLQRDEIDPSVKSHLQDVMRNSS